MTVAAALLAVGRGDDGADATSSLPVGDDFHVLGVHHLGQVITDFIGDGFVENTLIAETLEVELERLEFDAQILGDKANRHGAKVGVTGFGAGAGELFRDMLDEKISAGRGSRETFEQFDVGHGVGFLGSCVFVLFSFQGIVTTDEHR